MYGRRLVLVLVTLTCSALTGVAACSSDSSTPSGGTPTSSTGKRVSAASGGTVTDPNGNTTLVIPPGALAQDTDITLSILPRSGSAVVEVSEFGPNGLAFLKPATLAIKADAALATGGKSLTLAVDDGADFKALSGSSYANGVASGPIQHFSKYTVMLSGGAAVDAGADTGGGMDSGGGKCEPTGGLPAPAAGRAAFTATFSNAVNFSGDTTPFTSDSAAALNGAVTGPNESKFTAYNKALMLSDKTARLLDLSLEPMPVACKSYTTPNMPVAMNPAMRLTDGAQGQWWCGGTVIVDTVNGKSYTFHFDTVCKASFMATGTVQVTGKGAGTFQ